MDSKGEHRIKRKKALITGGEFGMGRGIALELAKEGYDIAFSYYPGFQNDEKAVEKTRELLREAGAECWCYPADLSKPEAAEELFRRYCSYTARSAADGKGLREHWSPLPAGFM